jgi:hypothetical protein
LVAFLILVAYKWFLEVSQVHYLLHFGLHGFICVQTLFIILTVCLSSFLLVRYLHEVCQPPIVHWNFKSSNILLDDKLVARVSDCGLSPLKSSGSATEVLFWSVV